MTNAPVSTRVGDIEVVALDDGRYPVDMTELTGIDRDEAIGLTCRCGFDCTSLPVNAFLLRMPFGNVIVDTGAGTQAGPQLGRLGMALTASGTDVESVSHVLLTHLHPDHVCGLLTPDMRASFPNAQVILHAREAEFWLDGNANAPMSERTQRNAQKARAALVPYLDRLRRVSHGRVLPGIEVISLPGHTPGHSGWLLRSSSDAMLFWGDVVHFTAVQMAYPDVTVRFDIDCDVAADTRRQLLALASAGGIAVAGAHLPYPGFGYVTYDQNAYSFRSRSQQTEHRV